MISIDTENDIDTDNYYENNSILPIFINILDDFLGLISWKYFLNQIHCQSIRKVTYVKFSLLNKTMH